MPEQRTVHPLLTLSLLALLALFCGDGQEAPADVDVAPADCRTAGTAQLEAIRAGVQAEQASNDVREAWAVQSGSHANVWFVAAMVYGPGIEDGSGPGVWAVTGDPESPGIVNAVNGTALSFTPFPDAGQTDLQASMADPGAREAEACAE